MNDPVEQERFMSHRRTILAFLVAPAIVPLIFIPIDSYDIYERGRLTWETAFRDVGFHFAYAYSVAITLGIPAYLFLRIIRALWPSTILFASAVVASLPQYSVWSYVPSDGGAAKWADMAPRLAWLSAEGLVGGIAFWFIARPNLRSLSDNSWPDDLWVRYTIAPLLLIVMVVVLPGFTVVITYILAMLFGL